MSQNERKFTLKHSFFVLLMLLVVGGLVLGDMQNGSFNYQSDYIAKVGPAEITPEAYTQALEQKKRQFATMTGQDVTIKDLMQQGIDRMTLEEIIDQESLYQYGLKMGMKVSKERAAEQLLSMNIFNDPVTGKFDTKSFREFLKARQMSEDQFLQEIEKQVLIADIGKIILSDFELSLSIAGKMYQFQKTLFKVKYIPFNEKDIDEIKAPDDKTLESYYKKNVEAYEKPEYRDATILHISADTLSQSIDVTDEDIVNYHKNHVDLFGLPEKRDVAQLLFDDEDQAKKAYEKLKSTKQPKIDVEKAGYTKRYVSLGKVEKKELSEDAANKVFSIQKQTLSEPIKTGFGYALYYVHSIDAQQLKPLDDKLKKEIAYTIRLEKFGNKLYSSIEEMEDMQAGGATVEEIAKKYNLKLQKFEGISKMARDKNNDFLIGMPLEVLDEIFASTVNAEEPLFNLPDNKNYYFYRVDKIEEKNTPELKQVKKNVLADWKKDQFKMALKNKVDNYTKAINENKQTFDSVANELDKKVKETTIQRGQKNDVLNTYASNIIFEAKKGQNFTLEVDDGKSYIIANLEKIVPPVTDTKEAHLDIVKLQADNSTIVMQEVYGQLMRSVKEKIGVEVNTEMVKTVLERY